MPACTFCKKQYDAPRGLTIFTFDGKSIFYCSSKCRRNAALKRDSKKVNWVRKKVKDKVVGVEKKVEAKVENVEVVEKVKVDEKVSEVKKEVVKK